MGAKMTSGIAASFRLLQKLESRDVQFRDASDASTQRPNSTLPKSLAATAPYQDSWQCLQVPHVPRGLLNDTISGRSWISVYSSVCMSMRRNASTVKIPSLNGSSSICVFLHADGANVPI